MLSNNKICSQLANNELPIRLWIFNHPIRYITEQIEFFYLALKSQGREVTISNHPDPSALNVVIENFNKHSAGVVETFCRKYHKRVGMILTEHLDFYQDEIFFHGTRLGIDSDYMHPATKRERLLNLILLREHTKCFFRLGDLPMLSGIERMLPGIPVITIPFPELKLTDRSPRSLSEPPAYDFIFTGYLTNYRRQILGKLGKQYNLWVANTMSSRRRRDALNTMGRFVLNIPQNENWPWISSMRVLAALRCGRVTVTTNTDRGGAIPPICLQFDKKELFGTAVADALVKYEHIFEEKFNAYTTFVTSKQNAPFPEDVFAVWGRMESEH
ncbi:hypothetical protein SAMN05216420_103194 [Nitrosospira sp. Nl5]|uniref:hypothetical protein n=1 Tax=Nitrosospira sp. Nl5 TaxID=200120 RepID=UPI00088BA3AD|nr:hypothetical protein [Nitrosospira sp. Nl5]SCY21035.1 hypothetical protein SAMN05216420_103194 [Nitrosospira sp. Nl5]